MQKALESINEMSLLSVPSASSHWDNCFREGVQVLLRNVIGCIVVLTVVPAMLKCNVDATCMYRQVKHTQVASLKILTVSLEESTLTNQHSHAYHLHCHMSHVSNLQMFRTQLCEV